MVPDIGFKHLNAIVSLARFGSFIAAASYLGISQPGLSRIIQQSEKKLGAGLFIRGSRTVSLTAAGHEFLPFAERMIDEFTRHTEKLKAAHDAFDARLTIATLMSVSHLVLPMALLEFARAYPQVFVEIREGVVSTINEEVRSGLVDFGIGNPDEPPSGVTAESVMEEAFFAVLPQGHPLAHHDVLQLVDVKDAPMVSMPVESGLRRAIDAAAAGVGVNFIHGVVTNQYSSLFGFVANGLGMAILPASVLPPADDSNFVVRPINPTMTRRIGVMHLADRPLSAASEAFLRTLRPLLIDAIGGSRKSAFNASRPVVGSPAERRQ